MLVTLLATGRALGAQPQAYEQMGDVLGRLHALDPDGSMALRPGGGWHHVAPDGRPNDELAATADLLRTAGRRVRRTEQTEYETLVTAIEGMRLDPGLPTCIVHPDLVAVNVLEGRDHEMTVIDWAGAGIGPRVGSLGALLWTAAARGGPQIDAVWAGYGRHCRLTPSEIDNLWVALSVRPLVLACWKFATGSASAEEAVAFWTRHRSANVRAVERTPPP